MPDRRGRVRSWRPTGGYGADGNGGLCASEADDQRHSCQESHALANKETLVVAGELINQLARNTALPFAGGL